MGILIKVFKINMIYWSGFVFIFILGQPFVSGIEINDGQLQFLADSLKMDECRKLSESLNKDGSQLNHTITGPDESSHVSCLRLLQQWNLDGQTFHQRLRELGHPDLANRLSRSVDVENTSDENSIKLERPLPTNDPRNTDDIIHIILAALVILCMLAFVVCRWCCCKSRCGGL